MTCPDAINTPVKLNLDEFDLDVYNSLHEKVRAQINLPASVSLNEADNKSVDEEVDL
jgi:hypothetical protein